MPKRHREDSEYAAFCLRIIRAMGERAANDPHALPWLARISRLADEAMIAAVREARRTDAYSWAEIGRELGITRQAAQQRFREK